VVDPGAAAHKQREKAERDRQEAAQHARHNPPPEHVATAPTPPAKGHVVLTLKGAATATFSVDGKQIVGPRLDTQLPLGKHTIDYRVGTGIWQHVTVNVTARGVDRQIDVPAPPREEPKKPPIREEVVKPPPDDDKGLMRPGTLKDGGKK